MSFKPILPYRSNDMKKIRIALTVLILICVGGTLAMAEKPFVFAHYYTWYTTKSAPDRTWGHWSTEKPSLLNPDGCDPEKVIFPPYIRQIDSCAYPLVGPYDSDDPEVVRWHMKLAKAAGIDALLVDWWGTGSWQKPSGLTHDAFVNAVLPIAEEEGMKVCLFDESPQFVGDLETVKKWAVQYLTQFKDSPAYLRIDGKPVYAMYQTPAGRLTPETATEIHDYVEKQVGPVYWIVDRILCRATNEGLQLYTPDEWLALDWVDMFMGYSTFGIIRMYKYEEISPLFERVVKQIQDAGHKVLLPVHPGHNNSKIATEPWVMPRENGDTFRGYLKAAEEAGADSIGITSFNEWPETTVIEPARTWADPYQYLKIYADWKGHDFTIPEEIDRIKNPPGLE